MLDRGKNICMPVDTSKATCGGGLGSKANSDYGDPMSDSIFNLNPYLRTLDKAKRAEMGLVGFQQGPASPKCGREFKVCCCCCKSVMAVVVFVARACGLW